MPRCWLLSACLGAICWQSATTATEPLLPMTEARETYEAQRSRARELIHQRAALEAQARRERIEARKRAGISLSRPTRFGYPYQHTPPRGYAYRQTQLSRGMANR